jgi:glycosyltransferase involved in cell wall biosynthesis
MPFNEYCIIQDDFQDLEEKILYLLEDDRYVDYGERAFSDYNENHTQAKCFERYLEIVKAHAKI